MDAFMAARMLACEELIAWHEGNRMDCVYMPARNDRMLRERPFTGWTFGYMVRVGVQTPIGDRKSADLSFRRRKAATIAPDSESHCAKSS